MDECDHEVVVCEGEWDISRAEEFARRTAQGLARRPAALILDFRPATFVDATTVGAICARSREGAERGVAVAVACAPTGIVRRVFELVHLRDVLPVAESVEDALRSCRER